MNKKRENDITLIKMDNPLDLSYLFSILNFEVSMFCSDVLNLLQIFFFENIKQK